MGPSTSSDTNAAAAPAALGGAVRWFGRLQLLRLLGKSERTMAWRAADPRSGHELMLVMPRTQPGGAAAVERWLATQRHAARLSHPQLAAVVEIGVQDGWPFVAYDPRDDATAVERASRQGMPGLEGTGWAMQWLQGLAFAHEAGVVHHDLQPYLLLVSDSGQARLAGLCVASEMAAPADIASHTAPLDAASLRAQRDGAERDVLASGVLLHSLLTGPAGLDDADIGVMLGRLPPSGRDIIRLPWSTAHPIAEPLRIIVNRSTDRQPRQRYRNARTLLRALEGWHSAESGSGGGPLALLADRIRAAGVLPSSPGASARAARLAMMERERTNELARVVVEDLALSFELLRLVNSAQVRGAQLAGAGPVLTVRRAIALLGLEGVRRAALGLRDWPGPLNEAAAADLLQLLQRCQRAGRVALALRPPGYDAEVVMLITVMQNLGRLVVQYHFADEAAQIRRLMQPEAAGRDGESEEPGMSEGDASYAVLGADVEAMGSAVARLWGLGDDVLTMIRRLPVATPVRALDSDDDVLRAVASCANEALDAQSLPPTRIAAALQGVARRYGRALGIDLRQLQQALQLPASNQSATRADFDADADVESDVAASRFGAPLTDVAPLGVDARGKIT